MSIRKINTEEFKNEVLTSEKPVVVNFFANWCMPCKMFSEELNKVDASRPEQEIVRLDVDQNMEISRKYGIMSIPATIILKNGEEVERIVGFRQAKQVEEILDKYVA